MEFPEKSDQVSRAVDGFKKALEALGYENIFIALTYSVPEQKGGIKGRTVTEATNANRFFAIGFLRQLEFDFMDDNTYDNNIVE